MRIMAAVVLLAGSLVGCVGHYSSERIEGRYEECLNSFRPMSGVKVTDWDKVCEDMRAGDYDYRLSARRFVYEFPSTPSGQCGSCPQRVITIKGY